MRAILCKRLKKHWASWKLIWHDHFKGWLFAPLVKGWGLQENINLWPAKHAGNGCYGVNLLNSSNFWLLVVNLSSGASPDKFEATILQLTDWQNKMVMRFTEEIIFKLKEQLCGHMQNRYEVKKYLEYWKSMSLTKPNQSIWSGL